VLVILAIGIVASVRKNRQTAAAAEG